MNNINIYYNSSDDPIVRQVVAYAQPTKLTAYIHLQDAVNTSNLKHATHAIINKDMQNIGFLTTINESKVFFVGMKTNEWQVVETIPYHKGACYKIIFEKTIPQIKLKGQNITSEIIHKMNLRDI